MTHDLIYNGERIRFKIENGPQGAAVTFDTARHEMTIEEHGSGRFVIRNGSSSFSARAVRDQDHIWVWLAGRVLEFSIPGGDHTAQAHSVHESNDIRAPMPGTIVKLFVAAGDAVEKDQVVAAVEAMKMEHPLRAPRSGIVAQTFGAAGAIVDADAVIVTLEPLE
jgi:biotin carboxyl carrier protein